MARAHPASSPAPIVVGVGASAGALSVFRAFLDAGPPTAGFAYVFACHQHRSEPSHLVELLTRHTAMPLLQVDAATPLESGKIYLAASDSSLELRRGVLRPRKRMAASHRQRPIDLLFRSLAEDRGEGTIGIVLSGMGEDGTLGLMAIRAVGGLGIVQSPDSAEYSSMPASAVAAGQADVTCRVDEMPAALTRHATRLEPGAPTPEGDAGAAGTDGTDRLLDALDNRTGLDFRAYRRSTFRRRVERRMALTQVADAAQYLHRLELDPAEAPALARDLLIRVTSFFRDPEAFAHLERSVLPALLADRPATGPFRVWVPGCATGEEAYSLAMLLLERLDPTAAGATTPAGASKAPGALQIFATDLDDDALAQARAGVYPASAGAHLSVERRERFFVTVGETLRVTPALRECVVFARHDILRDAPFSRLDLVSCRNLLIYLVPEAQQQILEVFHFGLRPRGCLFLGMSEGVEARAGLFETLSKKWHVYRRLEAPGGARTAWRAGSPALPPPSQAAAARLRPEGTSGASARARQMILDALAPPAALVSAEGEVLYFHGPVGRFLDIPAGEPTRDLGEMARPALASALRVALLTAVRQSQTVEAGRFAYGGPDDEHYVDVSVRPLPRGAGGEALFLVVFVEASPEATPPPVPDAEALLVRQLEAELQATSEERRLALQRVEEAEDAVRAAAQDTAVLTEEFKSTHEELETSREELQSLNEELTMVNAQLRSELPAAALELPGLLGGLGIGVLFVEAAGTVALTNSVAQQMLGRTGAALSGRPLADLVHAIDHDAVAAAITGQLRGEPGPARLQTRVLRSFGEPMWAELVAGLAPGPTGAPPRLVVLLQDVSERVALERALVHVPVRERQRVVNELHDGVGQLLTGVSMLARSLEQMLVKAGSTAADVATEIRTHLAQARTLIRTTLTALAPVEVGPAGLVEALRRLVDETAHLWGRPCELVCDPEIAVADHAVATHLHSIAREALMNAVRHAQASRVVVHLEQRGDTLRLSVDDDGVGLPPNSRSSDGLGLRLMRRRAELIGARLSIGPRSGGGTAVVCELAVEPAPDA